MTNTVQRLAELEEAAFNHEGRLLLLICVFSTGANAEGIRGITKLAKLDFLLRYPTYLERALRARMSPTRTLKVREFERLSVESRMVRYRFGPWDHRYPEILRRLEARGLLSVAKDGRTVIIRATEVGNATAARLRDTREFDDLMPRAVALRAHLDITATNLMKFIYKTFPEVISLRSNTEIDT